MSGSVNGSNSGVKDELSAVNIQSKCGSVQGINHQDAGEEVSKEKCHSIVGWSVLKRLGYRTKKGIVQNYDESSRVFKNHHIELIDFNFPLFGRQEPCNLKGVKYKDGNIDTIRETELLSCLEPHRRDFPHHLFLDPPVPPGTEPKRTGVAIMRAVNSFHPPPKKRARKGKKKGKAIPLNAQKSQRPSQSSAAQVVPIADSGRGNKRTRAYGIQAENAGNPCSPKEGWLIKTSASKIGTQNAGVSSPPGEACKQGIEHSSSDEEDETDFYYLTKTHRDFYYYRTSSDNEEQEDDEDPDWEP